MQSRQMVRVATAALLTATAYVGAAIAQQQAPIVPKPGPEHAILKLDAGTWEGKVELVPEPGALPLNATVVETSTIGCGGTCLVTDAKGSELMPGVPFVGHGIMTWDPLKKAYVGSWADNLMVGMARSETTYDPKTKKHTGWTEGLEEGKLTKSRVVVEYPTPTTRIMTSFTTGPDGKEFQQLKISYTKK